MSRSIAAAAAANLAAHFTWVQRQTTGMRARMDAHLVLADCGMPCDTFNAACSARLGADAPRQVQEAIAWFDGRPFSWWHGPGDQPAHLSSLLESAGLGRADGELAMWIDLATVRDAPLPDGLTIRPVRNADDLQTYARLLAALWSPPDVHVVGFYKRAERLLLAADALLRMYLGVIDGTPVATAEATLQDETVGLYNISTAPAFRRRGIGSAMTRAPLIDARTQDASLGILQAAPEGVSIYERVGFRAFGEMVEFKPA
jgi:ribosomal protein S18 acetylase RimI-like enzyme